MSDPDTNFANQVAAIAASETAGRKHHCIDANCQIYPDGTRRRNPVGTETNANATVALLASLLLANAEDGKYG